MATIVAMHIATKPLAIHLPPCTMSASLDVSTARSLIPPATLAAIA
jgi:hypothetical protein